jgi:hypothetical protein
MIKQNEVREISWLIVAIVNLVRVIKNPKHKEIFFHVWLVTGTNQPSIAIQVLCTRLKVTQNQRFDCADESSQSRSSTKLASEGAIETLCSTPLSSEFD